MITCEFCGVEIKYKRYLQTHYKTKSCLKKQSENGLFEYQCDCKTQFSNEILLLNHKENCIVVMKKIIADQKKNLHKKIKKLLFSKLNWKEKKKS